MINLKVILTGHEVYSYYDYPEFSNKADEIREQISYHTWNYKNKGPMSQGWYLKDDTGMLVGSIC